MKTDRPLNIVYLSNGDSSTGGAGNIAQMLADGMVEKGHQVVHLMRRRPAKIIVRKAPVRWFGRIYGERVAREWTGYDSAGIRFRWSSILKNADIIHFHDMALAWGEGAAYHSSLIAPTFITLHDYSNATGGCMYPKTCTRYYHGCGQCPQSLKLFGFKLDNSANRYREHINIANKQNVIAIAPSNSITEAAKSAAWKNGQIVTYLNPVDTDLFFPRKHIPHTYLKNSQNKFIFMFACGNLDEKRKGFDDFVSIASRFKSDKNTLFLAVGKASSKAQSKAKRANIILTGLVLRQKTLARLYSSADMLIIPSRGDTFNLTAAESISCGTPVASYAVGGIPEVLKDMPGCATIQYGDLDRLIAFMLSLMSSGHTDEHFQWKLHRKAKQRFSLERYLSKHNSIYYNSLISMK